MLHILLHPKINKSMARADGVTFRYDVYLLPLHKLIACAVPV